MNKIICLVFIFVSMLSLATANNKHKVLNLTNNANLSYVKEEIKKYEKEYFELYKKSSMNKELFCDRIELNIKALEQIKDKYIHFENDTDIGALDNMGLREFLDLRGDISFSIRNIEIILKKLQKRKLSCIKNINELENVKKNIKDQYSKNKENFINSINQILKINNEL